MGPTFNEESHVRPVGQEIQFPLAPVEPTIRGNVRKWKKKARRVGGNESPVNNHTPIGGKRRGFNDNDEFENYQLSKRGKGVSIYLCTKISPTIERLKICKIPKEKNMTIWLEKGEKIVDTYEGVELSCFYLLQFRFRRETHQGERATCDGNRVGEARYGGWKKPCPVVEKVGMGRGDLGLYGRWI
ncbi:hypothetical protein FH972_015012 [Carpinus fangiana]|uniref:AAA-type ATPase N-terminal domain-containing protein n=1 Tax=Carpinus fangiana TaxID=176857 RepID=A0A5N6RBC5_9ROSI|nr:hypothetical protein FH972_015012 [Carpinus fangiana]